MEKINEKATAILKALITEMEDTHAETLTKSRKGGLTLALTVLEPNVLTATGCTDLYGLYQYKGDNRLRKTQIVKMLVEIRKDESGKIIELNAYPSYYYYVKSGHEITSIQIESGLMRRINHSDQALQAAFTSNWLIQLSREYNITY